MTLNIHPITITFLLHLNKSMTNFIYHSYAMNASCMSENIFAKLKHFLSIHYSSYCFRFFDAFFVSKI